MHVKNIHIEILFNCNFNQPTNLLVSKCYTQQLASNHQISILYFPLLLTWCQYHILSSDLRVPDTLICKREKELIFCSKHCILSVSLDKKYNFKQI